MSDALPSPPPALAAPASRKQKSKKKTSRDENRMEGHREKTGTKTVQDMRSALFEKLFFGYSNVTTAMKNIELNQTLRTVHLPISTRSIGFMIQNMATKFQQLSVMQPDELSALVHSLYRITLFQVELKMEKAMELQHSRNLNITSFEDAFVPGDITRALKGLGAGFAPLVNYVSAIGYFKTTTAAYLPRHPRIATCCDPLHVRIHELRRLVVALANNGLAGNEDRVYFRDHNPIPGAIWSTRAPRREADGVEHRIVWLSNAADIMPAVYGITEVRNDISVIAAAVEKIGRKYPKYVSSGGIIYDAHGSICQLVSTGIGELACPTPLRNHYTNITGEHDRFWTPAGLSDPEFYMGVIYLFGEIRSSWVTAPECQNIRTEDVAVADSSIEYASVLQNLLN